MIPSAPIWRIATYKQSRVRRSSLHSWGKSSLICWCWIILQMKIATASVDNGKHLRTPCLKNVGYPAMELKSSNLQTSTLAGLRKSNYFCSPHQSTKLPINHPKTIQTSIRPFLWHDEQLYKFTPFNSKWIIYFHDILPISKRFKWNSYIDGNPRCLQLIFTRHRRSMLPNVFGALLWDSWKQTNKQIIPQWQLFLENWMFYWKVWNSILGMWHSDVFWVVWLSRNFW